MALLTLLLAVGLWQWTQISVLIQRDSWLISFTQKLSPANNAQRVLLTIAVPALVLTVVFALLSSGGVLLSALEAVVTIVVLIYSLGRGDWDIRVSQLRAAWDEGNGERALSLIQPLVAPWQSTVTAVDHEAGEPGTKEGTCKEPESIGGPGGESVRWQVKVMRALAYYGFERSFTVIFWFVLLGPVAVFVYRLSHLAVQSSELNDVEAAYAKKWLWLLEWPVLRLLGLTFALTGHFMGCIEHWRICAFCGQRSTQAVLSHYIQGALHIDATNFDVDPLACKSGFCDVVINLDAIVSLYGRTLLLWVCAITILWVF